MDYLSAIRNESDRFYATAEAADPQRRVPSCPDWNVADLVWHLGTVHWFWGTDIELGAREPSEILQRTPARPEGYAELVAWGRTQAQRLVSTLGEHDDGEVAWTWSPPNQTVGFVRRHQVQEAAVHRWDMQNAVTGAADPIDPQAASDSLDELLAVTLPLGVTEDEPLAGLVHIHCTDTDGEWLVHPNGRVEPVHAKGDVALRGTASDLLLAAYGRVGLDTIDVFGDPSLARTFLDRLEMR